MGRAVWAVGMALWSAALLGCRASAPPDSAKRTETPAAQPLSVRDIAERARASVVVVRTPIGLGTGFVVAPGVVATNLHVVLGTDQIWLETAKQQRRTVDAVVGVDEVHDLVLLQSDEADDLKALPLGTEAASRAGDQVVAVGTPQGLDLTVSTGIVSAVREIREDLSLLQITAPISPGSSGGPLFDERGRVIGVTTMILLNGQNLNFAIPSRYLELLLRQKRTKLSLSEFARRMHALSVRFAAAKRPPFPPSVAGFDIGGTLESVKSACPRKLRRAPNRAECAVTPAQVPFASGPVKLYFDNGRLIAVSLVASSLEEALRALVQKYGPPDNPAVLNDDSWHQMERGQPLTWQLRGGAIYLRPRKSRHFEVNYVSAVAPENSNY